MSLKDLKVDITYYKMKNIQSKPLTHAWQTLWLIIFSAGYTMDDLEYPLVPSLVTQKMKMRSSKALSNTFHTYMCAAKRI